MLHQIIDRGRMVAERSLATFGEIMPLWIIVDRKAEIHALVTPWDNDHEKDEAAALIRKTLREVDAVAYCFISECWMALAAPSELDQTGDYAGPRPAVRADRKEVVMINAGDCNGDEQCHTFPMIREPGKLPRLGAALPTVQGGMSGRFTNLMPIAPNRMN